MDKHVRDYVDEIHKEFSFLTKSEINKIMLLGFNLMHFFIRNGCDIRIASSLYDFIFVIGRFTKNSLKHYQYMIKKNSKKQRLLWNLSNKNKNWDGNYYFGLTEEQYNNEYVAKNIRKSVKWFTFSDVVLHKIWKELSPNRRYKHFFKYNPGIDLGFMFIKKNWRICNIEYIGFRKEDNTIELFK